MDKKKFNKKIGRRTSINLPNSIVRSKLFLFGVLFCLIAISGVQALDFQTDHGRYSQERHDRFVYGTFPGAPVPNPTFFLADYESQLAGVGWPGPAGIKLPQPSRMADPYTELARGAQILEEKALPGEPGFVTSVRILKTGFKYPLLRTEETLSIGGKVLNRKVMVADHIIVQVKDNISRNELQGLSRKHGFSIRKKMLAPNTYLVGLGAANVDSVDKAVKAFKKEAGVKIAERDYILFASIIPDDPRFAELWGMHNTGQDGGTADADIDAPEAWDLTQGSRSVLVGVIDTGVDYLHEDLAANIWVNPGEIPGNGVDDDSNGFVDDVRGWDFCNDDNDPMDDHSHGTHCAGTIGAVGNNGIGVVGVNWEVSILPIKFLNAGGSGTSSDANDAIYYSTLMGVQVTSNSWGGEGASQHMVDAIEDANLHEILFVAAAGNSAADSDEFPLYPAAYDNANIISVAATTRRDDLAGFSNWGSTSVDLGAPGDDILSCTQGNSYQSWDGTSMATPHVAGAIALFRSIDFSLPHLEVKDALLQSVDPIQALYTKTVSGGRLNVHEFVMLGNPGPVVVLRSNAIDDDSQDGTSGNGDGIINPGELIGLTITVANPGSEPVYGVTATLVLAEPDEYISIPGASIPIGDLPARSDNVVPAGQFLVGVDSSTPTPKEIPFVITFTDNAGNSWSSCFNHGAHVSVTVSGRVVDAQTGAGLAAVIVYRGTVPYFNNGAPVVFSGTVEADSQGYYSVTLYNGDYNIFAEKRFYLNSPPVALSLPPSPGSVDFSLEYRRYNLTVVDFGGVKTAVKAVNNLGHVVGHKDTREAPSATRAVQRAMLWVDGGVTDIGDLFDELYNWAQSDSHLCKKWRDRIQAGFTPIPVAAASAISENDYIVGLATIAWEKNGRIEYYGLPFVRGFIWSNGVMTGIEPFTDYPEEHHDQSRTHQPYFWPAAVNSNGVVAGGSRIWTDASSEGWQIDEWRATLWDSATSTYTYLGLLGGEAYDIRYISIALGIDELGYAVGSSQLVGNRNIRHAFLWDGTTLIDIHDGPQGNSEAVDINAQGQIAMSKMVEDILHAAIWENGTSTLLGNLDGDEDGPSDSYANNNAGQIVGATSRFGLETAFLWENGSMTDLNQLIDAPADGSRLFSAVDINEGGQIAGNMINDADEILGFLLTIDSTPPDYTLTVNIDGSGSVQKNPDQATYTYGTPVQLTANADPGWTFDHWSGDDIDGSTDNPETIVMNSNKTVTAHFTQDQYTLTINIIGSGSVQKNLDQATYTYGTPVQLTANADPGWSFDRWEGDLTGSTNPDTLTIYGDSTVTAHFKENITIVGARSYANHTGVGELYIDMSYGPTYDPKVEPRKNGITKLVFDLSGIVTNVGATATGQATGAYIGTITVTPNGDIVTVEFDPVLTDVDWWTITLSGDVEDSLVVGILVGDMNRGRTVDTTDASQVKLRFGQTASQVNAEWDFNKSGQVDTTDASQVKMYFGRELPAPPTP